MTDTEGPRRRTADIDEATQVFVGHRELLFSVVYNMLGTVADTEDVLQEVWLSWAGRRTASAEVENPRAYLVRMSLNQALAKRAVLSRRRETYVGQWLPEPVVDHSVVPDAAEGVVRTEAASMALLVVLETLAPVERAVFVLNEVFGYTHAEVAEMIDRSPAAVRQLAYRARRHVQARRPRRAADARVQREVTERFIAATLSGDVAGLLSVLAPEVTLWTDGGTKGPAHSLLPVHGWEQVAKVFVDISRGSHPDYEVRWRTIGGDPGAVVFDGATPLAVVVLDVAPDGQVHGIYSVTNPDKLSRVG
ncbi:RNA polymerase sigma factor SigJ [Nocardia goodfellowii]|uniref:RNA polymerase sigma-70 factor (ECF subfamily) n=1 Tax=Nocardia goodfellowii TaxID=882446 RepID=A0ABS4QJH0_9NOCA|nr:RNA polymerase sigma factor SigJ [Nocardia goodfellowii]MBP2190811.1 RNA polymerase sigma-70 factor (ECF subfamily) [Nocardia goodfellowii]